MKTTTTKQFEKITSYQGANFKEWFGDMTFEKSEAKLFSKKLPRNMSDKEIFAELKPTEVSMGEIFNALDTLAPSGWYLFYARDKDGVLRAVRS